MQSCLRMRSVSMKRPYGHDEHCCPVSASSGVYYDGHDKILLAHFTDDPDDGILCYCLCICTSIFPQVPAQQPEQPGTSTSPSKAPPISPRTSPFKQGLSPLKMWVCKMIWSSHHIRMYSHTTFLSITYRCHIMCLTIATDIHITPCLTNVLMSVSFSPTLHPYTGRNPWSSKTS